jgi:phospho-N-acetylmuramoyl-pentapeptide-transferase
MNIDPNLLTILTLVAVGFIVSLTATPALTSILYKYKLGKQIRNTGETPLFSKLHAKKVGTPTMGGILVWGTLLAVAVTFWVLDRIFDLSSFHQFNFITRRETLLPLGALLGAAIVGLADDFLDIRKLGHMGRGFRFRFKVLLYAAVAIIGAWWFYSKLDFSTVHIPLWGNLELGWLFIPFFILVVIGTSFSVNQTDGLDGLAGGVLLISFFAYGIIAYAEGRPNLAAFIGVICGSLLAFLWFNIYPARFFMGDTGSMALGVILAILAFLTNTVLLLPLIGFVFVIEGVSTILQIASKKWFGKKIFLAAPIHHHFEALGWPETKVTQRFWIISAVTSIMGMILFFVSR